MVNYCRASVVSLRRSRRGILQTVACGVGRAMFRIHVIMRGDIMQKLFILILTAMCMELGSVSIGRAQNLDWHAQHKMLTSQQKLEWHALKVQQQNRKLSWRGQRVSSAQRAAANHEMQRERRDLKLRQRDAMQDMRDRSRSQRDVQR